MNQLGIIHAEMTTQFRIRLFALLAGLMLACPAWAQVVVNSLGMKFVRVPAGEFLMGSDEPPEALARAYPQYERSRFEKLGDEAPVHRVRITRAFFLGQHEVTVGQFRRFLEESGYVPESVADGTGGYGFNRAYDPAQSPRGDAFEGRDLKYGWRNPGFAQGEDHPVLNVTWNDAVAMAAWLSRKEGPDLSPADRGGMGICLPGGRADALLQRRRCPRTESGCQYL